MDIMKALSENWQYIPFMVVAFFIYGFALNMLVLKPINRILDERAQRSSEAEELTKKSAEELTFKTQEYDNAVLDAKRKGSELRAGFREESNKFRSEQLAAARSEAGKILEEGGEQLEKDLSAIEKDLEKESTSFAQQIVNKILKRGAA